MQLTPNCTVADHWCPHLRNWKFQDVSLNQTCHFNRDLYLLSARPRLQNYNILLSHVACNGNRASLTPTSWQAEISLSDMSRGAQQTCWNIAIIMHCEVKRGFRNLTSHCTVQYVSEHIGQVSLRGEKSTRAWVNAGTWPVVFQKYEISISNKIYFHHNKIYLRH